MEVENIPRQNCGTAILQLGRPSATIVAAVQKKVIDVDNVIKFTS